MSNERPWLSHYPAGVPAEIDLNQYASIVAVLDEAFERYRQHTAFTNYGKSLTYGEIDALSRQFAGYLTGELKLKQGDRIAIMLPNVVQAWWW
jgi:long-chain acyl-CoA synthetase